MNPVHHPGRRAARPAGGGPGRRAGHSVAALGGRAHRRVRAARGAGASSVECDPDRAPRPSPAGSPAARVRLGEGLRRRARRGRRARAGGGPAPSGPGPPRTPAAAPSSRAAAAGRPCRSARSATPDQYGADHRGVLRAEGQLQRLIVAGPGGHQVTGHGVQAGEVGRVQGAPTVAPRSGHRAADRSPRGTRGRQPSRPRRAAPPPARGRSPPGSRRQPIRSASRPARASSASARSCSPRQPQVVRQPHPDLRRCPPGPPAPRSSRSASGSGRRVARAASPRRSSKSASEVSAERHPPPVARSRGSAASAAPQVGLGGAVGLAAVERRRARGTSGPYRAHPRVGVGRRARRGPAGDGQPEAGVVERLGDQRPTSRSSRMPGRLPDGRARRPAVQPLLDRDQVVAGALDHDCSAADGAARPTAGPGRPARRRAGRAPRPASSAPSARWPRSHQYQPSAGHEPRPRSAVSPTAIARAQRGVQVVLLGGQPAQRSRAARRCAAVARPLGQGQEVAWRARRRSRVGLAGLGQPLQAVRPDGLQHPVARPPSPSHQQRLVDQRGEPGRRSPSGRRGRADRARRRPGWPRRRRRRAGASSARSASSSRSQLQSTTARSVWCRGSAVRLPPVSSRNRSSSRSATCAGGHRPQPGRGQLDRQRHAVQRPADPTTAAASRRPAAKPGRTAAARSTQQPYRRVGERGRRVRARPAAAPAARPASSASPVMPSGSRLVARTRSPRAVAEQPVGEGGRARR